MVEQSLQGGYVTDVVRIDDTVRRRPGPSADFVHRLLGLFDEAGWSGAPRYLGLDDRGREILTFVHGYVPWESPLRSDAALAATARLVRRCHDLTAGSALAGGAEVVCHHDLSPKNTVYREGADGWRPVAFIDWNIVLWWQDRCWRGIRAAAEAGDPAMIRLRDDGVVESVREAYEWVRANRIELAAGGVLPVAR
jgi:hypothetical protein